MEPSSFSPGTYLSTFRESLSKLPMDGVMGSVDSGTSRPQVIPFSSGGVVDALRSSLTDDDFLMYMANQTQSETTNREPQRSCEASKEEAMRDGQICFPCVLYNMLEEAAVEGFESIVSWNGQGTAFTVHDRELFTSQVMPR